jgi:hypothetical protein
MTDEIVIDENKDSEELKAIAKSIKEDPPAKIHYEKCKFISQNKELYDEAMSEVFK